jgi:hypothetical protein
MTSDSVCPPIDYKCVEILAERLHCTPEIIIKSIVYSLSKFNPSIPISDFEITQDFIAINCIKSFYDEYYKSQLNDDLFENLEILNGERGANLELRRTAAKDIVSRLAVYLNAN